MRSSRYRETNIAALAARAVESLMVQFDWYGISRTRRSTCGMSARIEGYDPSNSMPVCQRNQDQTNARISTKTDAVTKSVWLLVIQVAVVLCLVSCSDRSTEPDDWEPWRTTDAYPAWSPDSNTIAFIHLEFDSVVPVTRYVLWRVLVSTGELTKIRDLAGLTPYGLTWDREGDWLTFPTTSGIYKIRGNGDSLIQLTFGQYHDSPTWSYRGDVVYFAINAGVDQGIWSVNSSGDDLRRLNDPDSISIVQPTSFPDSDTLTVFSYQENQFCLALYVPGEPDIASLVSCDFDWPASAKMLPDKTRVLLIANSDPGLFDLFRVARSTGSVERLTSSMNDRGDLGFDFSPDGQYVVYPAYLKSGGLAVLDLGDFSTRDLTPGREAQY
jgi:hypothetical protein